MSLQLDHVIVCVDDLDKAATRYERLYEVRVVEGGRHPGHGTANRIIPLGANYIELLAVVDRDEARASPFGSWALTQAVDPGPAAVCLRTNDLDAVCRRLGLEQAAMSRATTHGETLRWRVAGLEEGLTGHKPFFIQWDIPDRLHPGRVEVEHPGCEIRLVDAALGGEPQHLSDLHQWAPKPDGLEYVPIKPGERHVSFRLTRIEGGLTT